MAAYYNRTALPPPPEVIIYRYNDKLVYVKPAMDYEEAINLALQEFPILRTLTTKEGSREQLAFYMINSTQGRREHICISRSAWKPCVSRMSRGEIVTIVVVNMDEQAAQSPSQIEPPPRYLETPDSLMTSGSAKSLNPSSTRPKRRSWFQRS